MRTAASAHTGRPPAAATSDRPEPTEHCRPRRLQSRRSAKGPLCVQPSNSQVRGQTPHRRSEKSTRRSRACEYRAPWITRNSIRLQTRFSPHRIPAAAKSPALKRAVPGRGDNGNRATGHRLSRKSCRWVRTAPGGGPLESHLPTKTEKEYGFSKAVLFYTYGANAAPVHSIFPGKGHTSPFPPSFHIRILP